MAVIPSALPPLAMLPGAWPQQLVTNQRVDVGILQAGGKCMPQRFGRGDVGHPDLSGDPHEVPADPVFLHRSNVPPDGSGDSLHSNSVCFRTLGDSSVHFAFESFRREASERWHVTIFETATLAEQRSGTVDRFGLREKGQLLQAAVVLFGRKMLPHYPQCEVRMARFRGTSKNEFIDQRQVPAHAFQLFEEASLFLECHVPVAGWFEKGKWERQERPQYPFPALREAIVNALCHRDYSVPGGAIHLAMYDDRLEFISTGHLPPGITIEQLKTDRPSRLRNPLIAEPFYRRALIEKWGWGTRKIVETCLAGGYPEPEFSEHAGAVYVRFPAGAYVAPTHAGLSLTERQRDVLEILGDGKHRKFREIYQGLEHAPVEGGRSGMTCRCCVT